MAHKTCSRHIRFSVACEECRKASSGGWEITKTDSHTPDVFGVKKLLGRDE